METRPDPVRGNKMTMTAPTRREWEARQKWASKISRDNPYRFRCQRLGISLSISPKSKLEAENQEDVKMQDASLPA